MITIKYFGEIAEKTGKNIEELELENQTIGSVIDKLKSKYDLKDEDFQLAINQELVDVHQGQSIDNNDELALLSAFAGG